MINIWSIKRAYNVFKWKLSDKSKPWIDPDLVIKTAKLDIRDEFLKQKPNLREAHEKVKSVRWIKSTAEEFWLTEEEFSKHFWVFDPSAIEQLRQLSWSKISKKDLVKNQIISNYINEKFWLKAQLEYLSLFSNDKYIEAREYFYKLHDQNNLEAKKIDS